eukprot:1158602-Pelagomonas_calceolata.AAC.11
MDARSRCFRAACEPRTEAFRAVGQRAAPGSTMRIVNCTAHTSSKHRACARQGANPGRMWSRRRTAHIGFPNRACARQGAESMRVIESGAWLQSQAEGTWHMCIDAMRQAQLRTAV